MTQVEIPIRYVGLSSFARRFGTTLGVCES
jgi:hypothetical protein